MSKIRIDVTITNKEKTINKEVDAIKKDDRIVYKDDGIITLDIKDKRLILKRTTDNREMTLEFIENKKTIGKYNVLNHKIDLNIFTNKLIIKDDYIEIDYKIEDELINYKLVIK